MPKELPANLYPCPICGNGLTETYTDYMDSRILLEEQHQCDYCKMYSHTFAYGHTEERYGSLIVCHSWQDTSISVWENASVKFAVLCCQVRYIARMGFIELLKKWIETRNDLTALYAAIWDKLAGIND